MTQAEKWEKALEQIRAAKAETVVIYDTATREELYRGTLQDLIPPTREVTAVTLTDLRKDTDSWSAALVGVAGRTTYTHIIDPALADVISLTMEPKAE